MPDIDDRDPLDIFCIWPGRDYIIIVRNEFCMHAGLFTHAYDPLQLMILTQPQCDHDLVQPVLWQDNIQVINAAQDFDAPVFHTMRHGVIQDSAHIIPPFRIHHDPVYILLRRTAVPNQNDML